MQLLNKYSQAYTVTFRHNLYAGCGMDLDKIEAAWLLKPLVYSDSIQFPDFLEFLLKFRLNWMRGNIRRYYSLRSFKHHHRKHVHFLREKLVYFHHYWKEKQHRSMSLIIKLAAGVHRPIVRVLSFVLSDRELLGPTCIQQP